MSTNHESNIIKASAGGYFVAQSGKHEGFSSCKDVKPAARKLIVELQAKSIKAVIHDLTGIKIHAS